MDNKKMIDFSFIIPLFNNAKYIERCINSIVSQDGENYEILVVNDGSNDGGEKIVEKIIDLNKDKKIRIINQENKGVSNARNVGIDKASGKYVVFVDSDDMLFDKFFANTKKTIRKDMDIIKLQVKCIQDSKYDGRFVLPAFEEKSGYEAVKTFCIENKIFAVPWSYIIKRSFIIANNLKFKENVYHEDLLLIPQILDKAKKVSSIDKYGYIYIKRENSLSTSNSNEMEIRRMRDFIDNINELIKYFDKYEEKIVVEYLKKRLEIKSSNLKDDVYREIFHCSKNDL